MRRPIIPAVLLILLLLAYFTRWNAVATKTFSNATGKWVEDRWTGQLWLKAYGDKSGYFERPDPRPESDSQAWLLRKSLSWTWDGATAATLAWLFWALWASGSRGRSSS